MKTIVSVFLYVIICSIQIYAVSAEEINLNAKAAVIMDAESGKILYEKSKDQKMPNASTTKILTCLYILSTVILIRWQKFQRMQRCSRK